MSKSKPYQCEYCPSRFGDVNAAKQHCAKKHRGRRNKWAHLMRENDEPSMASRLVDAQIDASMGLPVDDDIEAMFPDEIAEHRRFFEGD